MPTSKKQKSQRNECKQQKSAFVGIRTCINARSVRGAGNLADVSIFGSTFVAVVVVVDVVSTVASGFDDVVVVVVVVAATATFCLLLSFNLFDESVVECVAASPCLTSAALASATVDDVVVLTVVLAATTVAVVVDGLAMEASRCACKYLTSRWRSRSARASASCCRRALSAYTRHPRRQPVITRSLALISLSTSNSCCAF